MKEWLKCQKENNRFVTGFSFALFVMMLLGVVNRGTVYPGFTDEADNFIGGMVLASGRELYRDFASQHMPVMYYVCAVLKLLGADSVFTFRLYFYVVLAVLWTLVAVHYRRELGIITSMGTGMLYITNMVTAYTCCVLAEQLQSIGYVIFFMEFLIFARKKELGIRNSLMISLAVFLSFGSAFVSVFAIFAIALAFLYVGIAACVREKKNIVRMFGPTVLCVLAPFVVLLISFAVKGTLDDFVYGAYTINREIYPEYLSGYGSSILASFVDPVSGYFSDVRFCIKCLGSGFSLSVLYLTFIRWAVGYAINFIFWIYYAWKKSVVQAVFIIYFTMMCGQRGFATDFHGLPYTAVTMCMAAYLIGNFIEYMREKKCGQGKIQWYGKVGAVLIAGTVCVYSVHYLGAYRSVAMTPENLSRKDVEDTNQMACWINRLTEEDETVLLTTTDPGILVAADRVPYKTGSSVPWMYEAFEDEEVTNLENDSPRVAVYRSDYAVWEILIRDYAPEFCAYVEQNYTQLDAEKFPELYVRNDYLEEARGIYSQKDM